MQYVIESCTVLQESSFSPLIPLYLLAHRKLLSNLSSIHPIISHASSTIFSGYSTSLFCPPFLPTLLQLLNWLLWGKTWDWQHSTHWNTLSNDLKCKKHRNCSWESCIFLILARLVNLLEDNVTTYKISYKPVLKLSLPTLQYHDFVSCSVLAPCCRISKQNCG